MSALNILIGGGLDSGESSDSGADSSELALKFATRLRRAIKADDDAGIVAAVTGLIDCLDMDDMEPDDDDMDMGPGRRGGFY